MDAYSYWFGQAYPNPAMRRDYIKRLVQDKPITAANLRLAHLLAEDKPQANVVITPNFDDFLSRALHRFGRGTRVCDHPATTARIDLDEKDATQLIHVHGTYPFYDACNLKAEITARAEATDGPSMLGLLKNALRGRCLIVVGYSGWDGDVIMKALSEERDAANFPHGLYWFCYRRAEADSLPRWLKACENLFVVAPLESGPAGRSHDPEEAAVGVEGRTSARLARTGAAQEPVLAADVVFAHLAQTFGLGEPSWTKDPLTFYAHQLEQEIDDTGEALANSPGLADLYRVRAVVRRIRAAASSREYQEFEKDSALERIRDLLRASEYRELISALDDVELAQLTATEIDEVLDAVTRATFGLLDNSEDEVRGYDHIVRICAVIDARPESRFHAVRQSWAARALFNKGVTLGAQGQNDDEIAAYDEVVRRFGDATEAALRALVARALVNKGVTLGAKGQSDDEIAAYDEVLRRFGDATEAALRDQVAMALVNKGVTLGAKGPSDDAIAAYDEVLRRFGDATEAALRELVARALFNKGVALGAKGQSDDAIAAFDEVLRRLGDATEAAIAEIVANARDALELLGKPGQ
jgi:tetratricopeptide (TPR) repeat protein